MLRSMSRLNRPFTRTLGQRLTPAAALLFVSMAGAAQAASSSEATRSSRWAEEVADTLKSHRGAPATAAPSRSSAPAGTSAGRSSGPASDRGGDPGGKGGGDRGGPSGNGGQGNGGGSNGGGNGNGRGRD